MAFIATLALMVFLIFRPQEIWVGLNAFRLLDVFTALVVLGVGVDFVLRRTPVWRTREARPKFFLNIPHLPFLAGFLFFAYFTTVLSIGRSGIQLGTSRAVIAAIFMLAVAYSMRTQPKIRTFLWELMALAAVISVLAIQLGRAEPQCLEVDPYNNEQEDDSRMGEPDGRTCTTRGDCVRGGRGDMDYECEKLGPFKTVSVERRTKWRGQLGDPNELAVFLGGMLPFLLAAMAIYRNWASRIAALLVMATLLYAIILTGSRGGQLVTGIIFTVYFIMRFGWKGALGGAVLAAPVLLLGGRGGENADSSADERQGILYDAIGEFVRRPIGQGIDQFTEDHRLTAHNAYVLAAVDLGFLGYLAWIGLLWVSIKIPLTIVRRPAATVDPALRQIALASMVSMIGISIGIFFLSFTYKQLLFVLLGLSGGLYSAMKNDDPAFEVKIGPRDIFGLLFGGAFLLGVVFLYTRLNPK